ncbi:MAG: hypothetical protein KDE54_10525, partial [Caldilineaceae bacterium]|nr:hypothetical protein [Caldilineaceae bacterium]MCB0145174.1 hypothetical protein [Caldilineaceae bacterium]
MKRRPIIARGAPSRTRRFTPRDTTRINNRIRVPEVRVIGADGQQLGIMQTRQALSIASEQELDLVEVAP